MSQAQPPERKAVYSHREHKQQRGLSVTLEGSTKPLEGHRG